MNNISERGGPAFLGAIWIFAVLQQKFQYLDTSPNYGGM